MQSKIQSVIFWQEEATIFKINAVQINSFGENGSANVAWSLLTESEKILRSDSTEIKDMDYSQWGSDDNYLLSKVAEILQIVLISE
jgi:hypothetical protein